MTALKIKSSNNYTSFHFLNSSIMKTSTINVSTFRMLTVVILSFLLTTGVSAQKTIMQKMVFEDNSQIVFETRDNVEVVEWDEFYTRVHISIDCGKHVAAQTLDYIISRDVFKLDYVQKDGTIKLSAPNEHKIITINGTPFEWGVSYKVFVPKNTALITNDDYPVYAETVELGNK